MKDESIHAQESANLQLKAAELVHNDLCLYLLSKGMIDEHFPEAPDLEDLWVKIGSSYMPDAIREFGDWPIVSFGWIMYVGMAVAKYWDEDWEVYGKVNDLYTYLRDRIDFDHMDDYICDKVLLMEKSQKEQLAAVIGECASRTLNTFMHMHLPPLSREAYEVFVAMIHQMYLMGVAMELKALGYHMTATPII